MDANEMSYEFDVLFDKIASFSSPGYTAKEKSVFLTKAEEILCNRYQSAEFAEKRRRDLANMTRTVLIQTPSSTQDVSKPNAVRYDLPADLMYIESEFVTVTSTKACFDNSKLARNQIPVIPKREDEYVIQIRNPHKKPLLEGSTYDCVWRLDFYDNTAANGGTGRVDLITDGTFDVVAYRVTYFKKPAGIVPVIPGDTSTTTQVDSELNFTAHREIVDIAIRIAAGVTNPQDYQIKLNEEKINN